eukprot:TRINITY_DN4271_c0_g2_i1.p1 TRINITY_DN4271_c0_g2~~TRINITY_DN4271_c0_g2_i1.p1  ORF type:complete len:136 (-),score=32.66 TRINITY_DN4271_c0_g2_i1:10-417(-)
MRYGLTLQQVNRLLNLIKNVSTKVIQSPDPAALHLELVNHLQLLSQRTHTIIINFWRNYKDHKGGHFSIISSYCKEHEAVLILDVSKRDIKPHWIKLQNLVTLMVKLDLDTPRGAILLTYNHSNSSLPTPSQPTQ